MPTVSLATTNLSEEMAKAGTGAKSIHPAGDFIMQCVAIEFNQIKTINKQHKENYFFFHWKSEKGMQYDYCSLSPKAIFNFANRVKACNAGVSNPSVVNYCGLVGRYAKITIEHEDKEKNDGTGTYKVSNVKYINVSDVQQQPIDLSNPVFQNAPAILQGYEMDIPDVAQGFMPSNINIGNPPPQQPGYNPVQGQQMQYQNNNFQQPIQPQTQQVQYGQQSFQQQQDPYQQPQQVQQNANFGYQQPINDEDLPF